MGSVKLTFLLRQTGLEHLTAAGLGTKDSPGAGPWPSGLPFKEDMADRITVPGVSLPRSTAARSVKLLLLFCSPRVSKVTLQVMFECVFAPTTPGLRYSESVNKLAGR